jgi:hypothetical protein
MIFIVNSLITTSQTSHTPLIGCTFSLFSGCTYLKLLSLSLSFNYKSSCFIGFITTLEAAIKIMLDAEYFFSFLVVVLGDCIMFSYVIKFFIGTRLLLLTRLT